MRVSRRPLIARVFVVLFVCAGMASVAARRQQTQTPPVNGAGAGSASTTPAASAARPMPPEQVAYNAATKIKDPAEELAALEKVRTDFPGTRILGQVNSTVLTVLITNFPDRKDAINAAIDQSIAGISPTATADSRLSTIQGIATRLTDKKIALDKIEPLLTQAYAAFDPKKFADEQKALATNGRVAPLQSDLDSRVHSIQSSALETMGSVHLAMGDADRAEKEFKDALAASPSASKAPLALAEMAAKRGEDKVALDYYMLAELGGKLKAAEVGAMDALYTKVHGSDVGLSAELDKLYVEKFPNPVKAAPARTDRMALAELFTGSGCPPCVAADLAWDGLIEHYGPDVLATLEFHANIPQPDPMVVAGGDVRRLYYKVPGVPTIVVDGVSKVGGGARDGSPKTYDEYVAMIDKALGTPAQAAVSVHASTDGKTVKVTATASKIATGAKDVRMHVVLAEREIHFTGENGVRFHSYVVRGVAAPKGEVGTGFPITNLTDATSVEYTFDLAAIREDLTKTLAAEMKKRRDTETTAGTPARDYRAEGHARTDIDPNALIVVAYVQDADKHVLQATRIDVPGLTKPAPKGKK
jgi:hypothetical protein